MKITACKCQVQADKRGQETKIIQLGAVKQKVSLIPAKYCNIHFIAVKISIRALKISSENTTPKQCED